MLSAHCPSPLALISLCFALCLGLGVGCASLGEPVPGTGPAAQYPDWVQRGSAVVSEGAQGALYGLGEVRGIRNVALARSTADNRARAELVRLLDAFVARWLAACPDSEPSAEATAQGAQPWGRQELTEWLVASNLPGVQIIEHHFHPKDGAVFALARLQASHMVQHLQASPQIPNAIKNCLVQTSESILQRLGQTGMR